MQSTPHRILKPAALQIILCICMAAADGQSATEPEPKEEPADFLQPARFGKILPDTVLRRPSPPDLLEEVVLRVRLDGEAALVERALKLAGGSLAEAFAEGPQRGPLALLDEWPELCRRREKHLVEREDEDIMTVTGHAKWPALMERLTRIVRKDPMLKLIDDWSASSKEHEMEDLVAMARDRVHSHSGKERRAAMRVLIPFMDRPEIARSVIEEQLWFVEHGQAVNGDALLAMYHHHGDLDSDLARPLLQRILTTPRQHATRPRMIAAIILGCLEDAPSLPLLLRQLNDPHVDAGSRFVTEYHQPYTLRECLCFAVARLADASAFEALVANLWFRGTPRRPLPSEAAVRGTAAEGLARIADRRAVLHLCNLLAVEKSQSVVRAARDAVKTLTEGELQAAPATGVTVDVPEVVLSGGALPITVNLPETYRPDKLAGVVRWRLAGEEEFRTDELVEDKGISATLPPAATAGPLEFYVQFTDPEGLAFPQAPPGEVTALIVPDTGRPELPAAPEAVEVNSHAVTLQWPAARDDAKVAGYRVYRGADREGLVVEANLAASLDASQRRWTDTPRPGTKAVYAIVPTDSAGRMGEPSHVTVDVPPDTPPPNDLSVRVCVRQAKELVLVWSGKMAPDVAEIEIQRAAGNAGEFRTVATVAVAADLGTGQWADTDVSRDKTYRYRLRLRDEAGHAGPFGDVIEGHLGPYARRINCGGHEVIDEDPVIWESDRKAIRWSAAYRLDRLVENVGSAPQDVYRIERWSSKDLDYEFQEVPPGEYEIVLHLAESNDHVIREGERLFDVVVNGETVASNVDVYRRADGGLTAQRLKCRTRADEGTIRIQLEKVRMGPAIKGIEVRPAGRS